jgi:hypothetical protein
MRFIHTPLLFIENATLHIWITFGIAVSIVQYKTKDSQWTVNSSEDTMKLHDIYTYGIITTNVFIKGVWSDTLKTIMLQQLIVTWVVPFVQTQFADRSTVCFIYNISVALEMLNFTVSHS